MTDPSSPYEPHPLRLAWVVPGSLRQLTGGYLYDARIVDGLRSRGHRVGVFDLRQRSLLVDPIGSLRLGRVLRRSEWDAVVIDELAHPSMMLGLPLGKLAPRHDRPVLVVLVHHLRASEPLPSVTRRLVTLVERAGLAQGDAVVCTSRITAARLRQIVPQAVPIAIVEPGCDQLPRSTNGLPSRDQPDNVLRVLTVAHWTPRKGIVEALRAVALANPRVRLDLVGDPDRDRVYARRVCAELSRPELIGRVRVHGTVSSQRLAALYREADVFLLASRHEGYGMVLAEALSAGLPIVATRVGAVPEVVRDGCEAELVPSGDVAGLARALNRLASSPAERARRAALAREHALNLPSWDQSCTAFERSLMAIVQRRRAATGGAADRRKHVGHL